MVNMSMVRINVDTRVGEVEIVRTMWDDGLAATGKEMLAETLVDAANAVLRSYGIKEELAVVSEAAAALQRLRKDGLDTVGVLYRKGKEVGD
jgi:hypothetical protein